MTPTFISPTATSLPLSTPYFPRAVCSNVFHLNIHPKTFGYNNTLTLCTNLLSKLLPALLSTQTQICLLFTSSFTVSINLGIPISSSSTRITYQSSVYSASHVILLKPKSAQVALLLKTLLRLRINFWPFILSHSIMLASLLFLKHVSYSLISGCVYFFFLHKMHLPR